tara:strand:- start:3180 stop:3842 length:663 start_codon:yes stop_codon:yes gene_type:complete
MASEYFIDTEKITIKDKNYEPNIFPNTWFVQEPIDIEHKHWKLLAYLKRIDTNVKKGFLFQEYETLEKRYKDLESFISTYEIVNKDKESEKLFDYIYELHGTILKLKDLDIIVERSAKRLREKYVELKTAITFLKDNIKIVRKEIRDKRKNLHIYIEMCNCSIIEHYVVSKKGKVHYEGSFHSELKYVDDEINNVIEVKTDMALNSKGITIPYVLKVMLQ